MYLLKALKNTLIELSRARAKSGRSLNEYNFIRNRVLNSVELHFKEDELRQLIKSFDQLPHRVSQQPTTVESHQVAMFLQHLIDDFTSVLLMIEKKGGDVRELFISDSDFACEIISKHSTGWMDSCTDCGQSLHLKYDLFSKKIVLAQKRLRTADDIVCAYRLPKPLELTLFCPSKKLVVSDSLNDFVVANSATLAKHYDAFLSGALRELSSTSLRGKALLSEFYASHNLGYFCVGKGALYLTHDERQAWLTKQRREHEQPFINVSSLFVTMMDYAEFCGFCNQLGLDIHQTLKMQDARIIDVAEDALHISYTLSDSRINLPIIHIAPASGDDSSAAHFINAIA
jgi:hypothetical protein